MRKTGILILLLLLSCTPQKKEVTLVAVGDVMLGRYIAQVMKKRGNDFPFREISPELQRADIVFGNLEAVISGDDAKPAYPDKPYSFHASATAAPALRNAGFTVLSLANNHAMDYGSAPLRETKSLLEQNRIHVFGAGSNIREAREPAIVTIGGTRFGFLGYGVAHATSVYADGLCPGIAPIRLNDIEHDITALRNKVDVLVVSLHWGMEYDNTPSEKQRIAAHRIIDWGADVILGHHPHVMQGVEIYKGRIIAYSLGNFVFDQRGGGTDRSFMLELRFRNKKLSSAELVPLDRFQSYFPKPAENAAKKQIMLDLKKYSLPLNREPGILQKVGIYK